ncbi:hypothetical protein QQS21_000621 [Conoideocrella luteorostrata]|uniref:SET domain-containing protein n=1 Tax=Conoideocrella luteorostrata TaxID=1105319 RepID=A0AAJ0D0Z9_9HYPO|nr:hypothetical protein QQS21_000621 [Conoideocrella luteorostrata]
MDSSHPYLQFRLPNNAPFELRPSPGKGWGAFATRPIKKGDIILKESVLFLIDVPLDMPVTSLVEPDITRAIAKLHRRQKQLFEAVRKSHKKGYVPTIVETSLNNCLVVTGPSGSPCRGVFLLQSRFNHSCVANSKVPMPDGTVLTRVATKDIAADEETTNCYLSLEGMTRQYRHGLLGFVCDCAACELGTPFQQASEMRRQLIRGLQFLLFGVDNAARVFGSRAPVLTDTKLKRAAEKCEIPIASRVVYELLIIVLGEYDGLTDTLVGELAEAAMSHMVTWFKTPGNAKIGKLAMAQKTWTEKLAVALGIFGRRDAADDSVNLQLRKSRGIQ